MTTSTIDTRKDATMAGRHAARRSLRDDLFLLAHDEDHHFRPRTHPRALAIGLAGALFLDLLQDGAIWSQDQHVRVHTPSPQRPAADPITEWAIANLTRTGGWQPLHQALTGTAAELYERTLIHLITTDVITAKARRFGRIRYRPADLNDVVNARHYPRYRVQTLDRGAASPDPATDALCALIHALRIEDTLYLQLPAHDLQNRLNTITTHYPTNHPHLTGVPDLITAIDTALGDVAVAVYR